LTGIVGYSTIKNIDQMKNALYFRGDVGVSINAGGLGGPYSDNYTWPSDNKDLHEQAYLGMGVSNTPGTNHGVAIIGWGPCRVIPCNSVTGEEIEAECWIGKYFLSIVALLVN
jgi:hypothetical protein